MKPYVSHPKDGSMLVEWVEKDYRFGFSFEKEVDESSWYFVSKNGETWSGQLPQELLDLWHVNKTA